MCTGERYSGLSLKWGEFFGRNHGGEYDATPFKRNYVYYISKTPSGPTGRFVPIFFTSNEIIHHLSKIKHGDGMFEPTSP